MLTYLGKLLVLLNAFAAVAVLAWATSAYVTKVDPNEAVDVAGERLTAKVKRLDATAKVAQRGYAPELVRVGQAEQRLADIRGKIAGRLEEAETGTFFNIYADEPDAAPPRLNPNALDRYSPLRWDSPKGQELKGEDLKPLKGVAVISKEWTDELRAASEAIAATKLSVEDMTALNADIAALNARYAWLEEIDRRHTAETAVLVDLRVTWENRGGSLQRRRSQLINRLDDLKGKASAAPAQPGGSALTVTPNK